MGVWNAYERRMMIDGLDERDRLLIQTKTNVANNSVNSLSSHRVLIDDIEQTVTILNQRGDMALKKICALPGESLEHGGIVDFASSKWLITEIDANDEVYASGMMRRCNYLLRWLNHDGEIIEKWCVVEDGTKYLIGEKDADIMSVGDARIAITIRKDADTEELGRGKRFLVDDVDSSSVLAYQITKPNKLFNIYNGKGVFRFILNEVNLTDDDNVQLRIADYYNWKPYVPQERKYDDSSTTIESIVKIDEANEKEGGWI